MRCNDTATRWISVNDSVRYKFIAVDTMCATIRIESSGRKGIVFDWNEISARGKKLLFTR